MRHLVVPLFAANGTAFLAVGISYFLYSRMLDAHQFGTYSAALAVGNLAVLVLDGGIKTSIIKHAQPLSPEQETLLLRVMLGVAGILLVSTILCRSLIVRQFPAAADQTNFIVAFAALYLATYPWIGLSTAQLERDLAYGRLAWIESLAIVLERGLPAVILATTDLGLMSFLWGLALGRGARVIALLCSHRVYLFRSISGARMGTLAILREGVWYQMGAGASLVRDNLHVLIVGPLFGSSWVGYYAWGLQLCIIASQIFVQIAARVSLPVTAKSTSFEARWLLLRQQAGLLTAVTTPILAATLVLAPAVNSQMLADRWDAALLLLPWLFARMVPGVVCAPLGTLLLVESGARTYTAYFWLWTAVEAAAAALAVWLMGSMGLAVSYAVTAWVGVVLMIRGLRRQTSNLVLEIASDILRRPAMLISLVLIAPYLVEFDRAQAWLSNAGLIVVAGLALAVLALSYIFDRDLTRAVFGRRG